MTLCKEAGIEGNIVVHSLRVTSATQIYDQLRHTRPREDNPRKNRAPFVGSP
jgi:hypothetical protein